MDLKIVKKITVSDAVIVAGLVLTALGLGLKMKEGEEKNIVVTSQKEEVIKGKVNLNKASKIELMSLPGIGEKTAIKIINYRERVGKFRTKEELMEVGGIGEKKYEEIKELVEI